MNVFALEVALRAEDEHIAALLFGCGLVRIACGVKVFLRSLKAVFFDASLRMEPVATLPGRWTSGKRQ